MWLCVGSQHAASSSQSTADVGEQDWIQPVADQHGIALKEDALPPPLPHPHPQARHSCITR